MSVTSQPMFFGHRSCRDRFALRAARLIPLSVCESPVHRMRGCCLIRLMTAISLSVPSCCSSSMTMRESSCINPPSVARSCGIVPPVANTSWHFSITSLRSSKIHRTQPKTWKKEWKCDLILDSILRSIFGPKNGVSYRRICCPHILCKQICDPAAWTWMSTHIFFSLCVSSPVATVQETKWDAEREKCTYAHANASQICLQNLSRQ